MQMKRNCVVTGIMAVMLVTATGCGSVKEVDRDIEKEPVIVLVDENNGKDNSAEQKQGDETEKETPEDSNTDAAAGSNGSVTAEKYFDGAEFVADKVIIEVYQ